MDNIRVSKLSKKKIQFIVQCLLDTYPDAAPELKFNSHFEMLVAVILSAQCTDKRVNEVTRELFGRACTPEAIVSLPLNKLEEIIRPCGLFHTKAKNIMAASERLLEIYEGQVPDTLEALMSLPGVGRKTANVVISNAFGVPAIAVDTHVFRVSARLGLASGLTVEKTEQELMEILPRQHWTKLHHCLIFHGRRVCKARNPACDQCTLLEVCGYGRNDMKRKEQAK